MPAEHPAEPTLVQHVEAVRDELRAEQRALEELPRKNAWLREEIERLETRRQELRSELEALRQGRPISPPRLPEVLSPPFTVKVRRDLRRPLHALLFAMCLAVPLILVPQGLQAWPYVASFWGVLGGMTLVTLVAPPRWRFEETVVKPAGIPVHEQSQSSAFSYREIRDVQVLVTPSQKRRGVGTVVITCWNSPKQRWAILRNVPEPERLAEWIRSKCDSARNRSV